MDTLFQLILVSSYGILNYFCINIDIEEGCFTEKDCKNGAICSAVDKLSARLKCFCPPGFRGPKCGIKTCDSDCSERGSCDERTFNCVCNKGWAGKNCEKG